MPIRGWLQIVRGIEKPPAGGVSWQEYAFRRSTDANPFPAIMGRVCPAPCQEGCNRNEVEDFVGINSVEQFIGDHALAQGFDFDKPQRETGKRVAIVGGGVAGQAAIAADSIDRYLNRKEVDRRPKVDVHHFKLLDKLRETALAPQEYGHGPEWGTDSASFAVHNYEDRSRQEIISHEMLFLGHFPFSPRHQRMETGVGADEVLGHFEERFAGLPEEEAQAEAGRCMSCGMCFECDNCVIYCPQDAVKRTPKDQATMGRYVYRCIGCHICAEVCPTGYINMGLGA